MPTARIKEDDEEEIDARKEAEELAKLNRDGGGDLFSVIEELQGSAGASGIKCIVTRTAPEGKTGYVGRLSLAEFSLDKVRTLYGPGRYMVQIKGPKGFLPGGKPIEIAETQEDLPPKATGGDFQTFLEYQRLKDEQRRQEEAERRAKTHDLLIASIPTLGTIIAGIFGRPQMDVASLVAALKPPPGPSLADLSQVMVNMKSLNAPAESKDPLDLLTRVVEIARDMGPESGAKGSTNWLDIVKELIGQVGPAAGPILQAVAARGAMNRGAGVPTPSTASIAVQQNAAPVIAPGPMGSGSVAPVVQPTAVPVAPASSVIREVPAEMDALMLAKPLIVQKLLMCSEWARENKDPEVYSQLLLREHIPAYFSNIIPPEQALEYLRDHRWFQVICEWQPALKPYEKWCDRMRRELIYWVSQSTANPEEEPEELEEDIHHPDPPYTGIDSAS